MYVFLHPQILPSWEQMLLMVVAKAVGAIEKERLALPEMAWS